MRSFRDWLAPQAGISDITKDLRHAIIEIVSKHGLHHVARGAWASPFMQDKHNDKILEARKSLVQAAAPHPDLSIHPYQPCRFGLIRHLLQLMPDPDTGLIDFEPIQFSSRRTSTPSSFRSSKVTSLKAKRRAFGRRSVARTGNRDPCLCSDSTIANVNAKVQIEEKSFNPCVEDITSSKVVTHPSEGWLHDRRQ